MNINEIAKMAGVSASAVSRYLNQGYLSEEKKKRIAEVIEQTGYVPSTQAQMLRTKKTKLIGVAAMLRLRILNVASILTAKGIRFPSEKSRAWRIYSEL